MITAQELQELQTYHAGNPEHSVQPPLFAYVTSTFDLTIRHSAQDKLLGCCQHERMAAKTALLLRWPSPKSRTNRYVDGQNPVELARWLIRAFTGFHLSGVVQQKYGHQLLWIILLEPLALTVLHFCQKLGQHAQRVSASSLLAQFSLSLPCLPNGHRKRTCPFVAGGKKPKEGWSPLDE